MSTFVSCCYFYLKHDLNFHHKIEVFQHFSLSTAITLTLSRPRSTTQYTSIYIRIYTSIYIRNVDSRAHSAFRFLGKCLCVIILVRMFPWERRPTASAKLRSGSSVTQSSAGAGASFLVVATTLLSSLLPEKKPTTAVNPSDGPVVISIDYATASTAGLVLPGSSHPNAINSSLIPASDMISPLSFLGSWLTFTNNNSSKK